MMHWRWVVLLVVLAAVMGGLGVRWWIGSAPAPSVSPPAAAPAPPAPAPATPFLHIEGTNLTGADEAGRRLWEMQARSLQVDRQRNRISLLEVTGQLFQSGKPQLQFAAPRAVFVTESKDVELAGGVIGRTPDGRILRAATVRYDGQTKVLTASGGVTLTQPARPGVTGTVIQADSLVTDAGLAQTTFSGNVTVKVSE